MYTAQPPSLPGTRLNLGGAVEFPRGFLGIALLSQGLSQLIVSRSVLVGHLDRRPKLRNGTLHVTRRKQALS